MIAWLLRIGIALACLIAGGAVVYGVLLAAVLRHDGGLIHRERERNWWP